MFRPDLRQYTKLLVFLALVVLLVLGTYMIFATVQRATYVTTTNPQVACDPSVSTVISAYNSVQYQCPSGQGGWLSATITTSQQSSFEVTAMLSNGSLVPVYSSAGLHYRVLVPLQNDGALKLVVANLAGLDNVLSGSISVTVIRSVQTLVYVPVHPYRDAGVTLDAITIAALALIAIDPRGLVSRALEGSYRWRPPGADS